MLKYPLTSALFVVAVGACLGAVAQIYFGNNLFERFGSFTVAFAIVVFGTVTNLLQSRAQGSYIMDDDGEPPEPFKTNTVKRALNWQGFALIIGTLQWGFGGLLWEYFHG
ncbi:hypothetical protein [Yoonia rosea]|uniref:hypothetical protein n=1 Tax=Yoonia rosea TaxID=287098 RepID=UPI001054E17A|nr:hypothetical protein [Yoonia rosea]